MASAGTTGTPRSSAWVASSAARCHAWRATGYGPARVGRSPPSRARRPARVRALATRHSWSTSVWGRSRRSATPQALKPCRSVTPAAPARAIRASMVSSRQAWLYNSDADRCASRSWRSHPAQPVGSAQSPDPRPSAKASIRAASVSRRVWGSMAASSRTATVSMSTCRPPGAVPPGSVCASGRPAVDGSARPGKPLCGKAADREIRGPGWSEGPWIRGRLVPS